MYNGYKTAGACLILNKSSVYTFEQRCINKNAPLFTEHFTSYVTRIYLFKITRFTIFSLPLVILTLYTPLG